MKKNRKTTSKKRHRNPLKRIGIVLLAILFLLTGSFLFFCMQTYRADEAAREAMRSDEQVQVSERDYGWFLDGPGEEDALVFYSGARVEEIAYAPLLRKVAEKGMDVCLLRLPLQIAFLTPNAAQMAISEHDYAHWYVGGHSLGGSIAARYAATHGEQLEGLILLAAYSIDKLTEDLTVISIYGTEDKILSQKRYAKNFPNLPPSCREFILKGGNHSQFGSYGKQKRDGEAAIPQDIQIEETAQRILEVVTGKKEAGRG